ncbi:ABC transporter ATP-binding protein/permease [Methylococcus sp. Mc7]|uniref:ABC transporter ATP-binding protein/permease n=1 Tax=Methylococcus sp. Mc7 TaxID=2860258 RepID=UPI001C529741|nr:SbmA/BacA-like family transporter [Methylococcus sp. Mc7]QXP82640.1 ABC transporter ATP-binding protein/permease [Methylococcus sp. Mc7]
MMQRSALDRLTWVRFARVVKAFSASEVGGRGMAMFVLLIVLLLGINGLNVVSSYVGRDFMTAIADRHKSEFVRQTLLYLGVFGASTVVAVIYRFVEERLGLLWREWQTRRLVNFYLGHRTYYRLKVNGEVENPDQRIADDVRALTVTTLSFVLMVLNGSITVVAFSGVMWSISPLLFAVTILYAAAGTLAKIALGRPLVGLNYTQLDKEADFRSGLIHVRENAESIALFRHEDRLRGGLFRRLEALTANFRRIVAVNRNLGFFTTGFNYLNLIIPVLVVAPLFFDGRVEFGVIPQSAMAFAHLIGAFSLIVTQFQSISSFAAVVSRLGSLWEGIERAHARTYIKVVKDPGCISYEGLTLRAEDGRPLIEDLSVSVPCGLRVFVRGPNEAAKGALLRATAGIWEKGEGRIVRPGLKQIFFLPERPYLPPCSLRELLMRTGQKLDLSEDEVLSTLRRLNLEPVVARVGGLDVEQDWPGILSLGEQQLLAIARLLLASPRFVFLERPSTALRAEQVKNVLRMLSENSITYLTLGGDEPLDFYDAVLELEEGGRWTWDFMQSGQRSLGEADG